MMAEFKIDVSKLPEDVREKLAELDLELSEGKLLLETLVRFWKIHRGMKSYQANLTFIGIT